MHFWIKPRQIVFQPVSARAGDSSCVVTNVGNTSINEDVAPFNYVTLFEAVARFWSRFISARFLFKKSTTTGDIFKFVSVVTVTHSLKFCKFRTLHNEQIHSHFVNRLCKRRCWHTAHKRHASATKQTSKTGVQCCTSQNVDSPDHGRW